MGLQPLRLIFVSMILAAAALVLLHWADRRLAAGAIPSLFPYAATRWILSLVLIIYSAVSVHARPQFWIDYCHGVVARIEKQQSAHAISAYLHDVYREAERSGLAHSMSGEPASLKDVIPGRLPYVLGCMGNDGTAAILIWRIGFVPLIIHCGTNLPPQRGPAEQAVPLIDDLWVMTRYSE